MSRWNLTALCLALASVVLLAGCKAEQHKVAYSLTITNLTRGQPLSPPAIVLHRPGYQVFAIGSPASLGLEHLAEAGDNSMLLASARTSGNVDATESGAAGIPPGGRQTVIVGAQVKASKDLRLSYLSMLGNTNDGFAALPDQPLGQLAVGQSMVLDGHSYDAGTEANTETADTVPGPAAAGGLREGFNPARDDVVNEVRRHSGVVSKDDGLATSALTEAERWDDPVVRVRVTRLR